MPAEFWAAVVLLVGKCSRKVWSGARQTGVAAGVYCVLIGYLIFRSIFLPRIIGVLMAFAGLGHVTLLWQARYLSPYNLAPGALGGHR